MADTNFPDEWLAHSLEGVLTPELLVELRAKAQPAQTLWETLVAQKVVSDEQILTALSTRFRLKLADVKEVDLTIKEKVPEQLARRYHVLPLRVTDSFLEIATANPFDLDAEKALAFATAREIRMQLLAPSKISEKLDEVYRPEKALDKMFQQMEGSPELVQLVEEAGPDEIAVSEEQASQRPIVRLVDLIISEAILARSSDIHIEPEEGGVAVRYRIDGVLRQQMKIPRQAGLPLISRIKIMSSLDIADRLRPQDGRARVAVNGQPIDLRVSTLPAALGEKVVIRILDSRATVKTLDSLGLSPDEVEGIGRLLENHEGILLVTGPTGSGKTTTLYSCINQIKSEGVNIVTVEDPVEYRMQGIVQVQVQEKAGLTFASALRSILRQDPNVVLVGEIRDKETAQIAVQASLTGHLVLSTLHTNDAANAVTRLVDIGVEAYKIAASLRGVVAQRLMRKLCTTCKEVWMEAPPERARPGAPSRASGAVTDVPRGSSAAGTVVIPEPVGSFTTSFDLLEETVTPTRRSGVHGQPVSKVLLVDDEDSLRKVMRDLLERDGYDVTEARDGVQALDQVDRVGPDIIVLDLNLPGLDGYGVLSHLRSRPATANIPVIVLTAKCDTDNEVRIFDIGADDFLTKPFRARALSARLEAVLGRRR